MKSAPEAATASGADFVSILYLHVNEKALIVFEKIKPALIEKRNNALFIDFGGVYVGYLCVKAKGKSGEEAIIRCGQELNADGTVRYNLRANCKYEEKWILSDKYEENIYISITNSYVKVENGTFTILGNGKKDGNTFFLKSGSLFSKSKMDLGISIRCSSLNNGHSGGSGLPVLPYSAKKMQSATEYIYEFTTASRIIEYELIGGYEHEPFEGLIELLKQMDKNQLRLFRNSVYAKNDYVFKDTYLNNFFSSALCYLPDKSVTVDKIKIEKPETILIEMIQAAEKGKSPEAVFDKYRE